MRRARLVMTGVLAGGLLGIVALSLHLVSTAPQAVVPRVAVVTSGNYRTPSADWRRAHRVVALLREQGFVADVSVDVEYWMADGQIDRLPELAAAAVGWKPDVIMAVSTPAAIAVKAATETIPIVTVNVSDPVQYRLVDSLERPGGNLTGVTLPATSANVDRLSILRDLAPAAAHVGVLVDRRVRLEINPVAGALQAPQVLETASRLGLDLRRVDVHDPTLIDAQSGLAKGLDALLVLGDPMVFENTERIVRLAREAHLPAVGDYAAFARAGGLAAYSYDSPDLWSIAVEYVAKILRGTPPRDLPMTSSTKFHLAVNLKTAEALGVTVPPALLERAGTVLR